jgi:uncharacterized membrane protein YkvA (DUF1232 family)
MFWVYLGVLVVTGLTLFSLTVFGLVRWLEKREPYGAFVRLRTRQKLAFFRLMLADARVPLLIKAIPVALVVYLANPFDIIPDFIPVLGYLDDVAIALLALVLVIKFLPRPVVLDLLHRAGGESVPVSPD